MCLNFAQLYGNAHRYQVTPIVGEVGKDSLQALLHEMEESKTVNVAHHSDDPNVGLSLTDNLDAFKMYVGDTGLFVSLAFADKEITENIIYRKLLSDKLSANLGYVYENLRLPRMPLWTDRLSRSIKAHTRCTTNSFLCG